MVQQPETVVKSMNNGNCKIYECGKFVFEFKTGYLSGTDTQFNVIVEQKGSKIAVIEMSGTLHWARLGFHQSMFSVLERKEEGLKEKILEAFGLVKIEKERLEEERLGEAKDILEG